MASTNFGALTEHQLKVWSKDFWRETRNKTFIMAFAGTGSNAMIQRVTELKKTIDGDRAVVTLINETTGDGVVGDNQLKGNEEALSQDEFVIRMDQWRHAHSNSGKMNDQRTIVNFREEAMTALTNTGARVCDELAFLTMSGISYAFKPNLAPRVGSQLPLLKFAADVTAPSSRRHFRWNNAAGVLAAGDTTSVAAADTPKWNMLVDMKAKAVTEFMRPLRSDDGVEVYNVFMSPEGMASLKKDPDFRQVWREAQQRGDSNPLFKGTKLGGKTGIYIDGLNILEYRNVITTKGAASGSKWGAGGAIDGQRVLLCGAQALAFADWGLADWEEEHDDYKNKFGISIGKIFGLLKPKLFSTYAQSDQDFGVLCVDTAI